MKQIAHIENDLGSKFGVPRQSGLATALQSRIIFEPPYRNADALRGLEGFSHVWLIWDFSEAHREKWSPTVRPPRLGGNLRMGVFATRSPFRPNPIGLSVVKIVKIEWATKQGPVIHVEGADLMNGTPLWDIKPYLPLTDCRPEATAGFAAETARQEPLQVTIPESVCKRLTPVQVEALREILAEDPRPHYQDDEERIYGLDYAGMNITFRVRGKELTVL
ncbi:MAG: tRNA (N6-threonylcarbamoyladenosine(37)-N6)-methyltransferase TrmO [Bacteroidaceae bacterium]|nr:tRNA (N6-threonylcarbamoyladenosine(37)-N6)-methyltransferase TrmO [Bacteroidaceae bacterium]